MNFFLWLIKFLFILSILSCSGKHTLKPEAFDPAKAFAEANEKMKKRKYEEARAIFLEIKNRDLSERFAPFARLKTADSYAEEGEHELAIAEYRRFIEVYPNHKYAVYAQYQIAVAYFNQIEGPEWGYRGAARALEEFERLKRMFPKNPYKDIVEIKIERCRNTIADHEFLVGEFYYKKGSYTAALGRFEGLIKEYPDYKREADVLFYTGMSYKNLGRIDEAREYLNRLIEKYPNNRLTKDAEKELATMK